MYATGKRRDSDGIMIFAGDETIFVFVFVIYRYNSMEA